MPTALLLAIEDVTVSATDEKKSLKLLDTVNIVIGFWGFEDLSEIMFSTPNQTLQILVWMAIKVVSKVVGLTLPAESNN